jgi:hypothetical protein
MIFVSFFLAKGWVFVVFSFVLLAYDSGFGFQKPCGVFNAFPILFVFLLATQKNVRFFLLRSFWGYCLFKWENCVFFLSLFFSFFYIAMRENNSRAML